MTDRMQNPALRQGMEDAERRAAGLMQGQRYKSGPASASPDRAMPGVTQAPDGSTVPAAENVARDHHDPAVRQLGQELADIKNMLRGNVPGAPGMPGMMMGGNAAMMMHPSYMQHLSQIIHPGWILGPGAAYGGVQGIAPGVPGVANAPGAAIQPGQAASEKSPEPKQRTDEEIADLLRRIANENKEKAPQPASAEQHKSALSWFRSKDKEKYAKFVAEKKGSDPREVQRWMSAPRRWTWKFVSGFLTGVAAYTGKLLGTAKIASMLPATWLTASTSLFGVPLSGALLPVIAAAAVGVGVWQGVRWYTGMGKLQDRMTDEGLKAKKLRKEYKKAEKKGYNPDTEKIFARVNKRTFWRMQNFVPGLLGTLAGGGLMYEAHHGFKNLKSIDVGKMTETGKGWLSGFWERISTFFTSGGPVSPGFSPEDHAKAMEKWTWLGEREAGEAKLGKLRGTIGEMGTELGYQDDQIARLKERLAELERSGPSAPESRTEPVPRPVPAEPLPRAESTPPPATAEPLRPREGATTLYPPSGPSLLEMVQLENTMHLRVDNRGIWAIEDIIKERLAAVGIKDPKMVTWLTDALEDYTQPTSKHFKPGLLDQITNVPGVTQTTIPTLRPDGIATLMRTEYLFGNTEVYDNVLARISGAPYAEISNPTIKSKISSVLFDLFSDARTLITHSR